MKYVIMLVFFVTTAFLSAQIVSISKCSDEQIQKFDELRMNNLLKNYSGVLPIDKRRPFKTEVRKVV